MAKLDKKTDNGPSLNDSGLCLSSPRLANPRRGRPGSAQGGAAAIEFALVFVIFFAVFYAAVSYTLPLLLLQSFNHAATEAVRQSLALNPEIAGFGERAEVEAKTVISQKLAWMPPALKFGPQHVEVELTDGLLKVSITYPTELLRNVVPRLVLPGIGEVPRLPSELAVESSLLLVRP